MMDSPSNRLIRQYAAAIEKLLASLGIDPTHAQLTTDSNYGWRFQFGSAIIEIHIVEEDHVGYLKVMSPIIYLPTDGLLMLYRRLLELNLQMTSASLGVHQNLVWVFSERPLEGLNMREAQTIIEKVSHYADYLDHYLVNEFGGRLYSEA